MTLTVFKIPVFRYSLIVLLITCLCGIAFYLTYKYNKTKNLSGDVNRLITVREDAAQIDTCILILYRADNNSRLYSVTGNPRYLAEFAKQVKSVDAILDRITTAKDYPGDLSQEKVRQLMARKSAKTSDYIRLRHLSDSLMVLSVNAPSLKNVPAVITARKVPVSLDTPIKVHRKKLLGRIFDAFRKEKVTSVVTTSVHLKTDTVFIKSRTPVVYSNYYHSLRSANNGMHRKEREMLLVNDGIIQELIIVLQRFKNEAQGDDKLSNKRLQGSLKTIFSGFSELAILTIVLIIILIATLLYNLWKIFRNEKQLLSFSATASRSAIEKSAFLANMSHEIRTPLNSIAGFAEQLQGGELNEEQTVQIKAVRSSAEMLLHVVNQVLDYSKYEVGKMRFDQTSFLLDKVITELTLSMSVLAEQKGLALRCELFYDRGIYLSGDAFRLRQVIMNLLGNAIKFTATGEVVLSVWITHDTNNRPNLQVAVKDTGMGISPSHLPFIFKEFTQAGGSYKQNASGTGLGLAISKYIVELQGGTLTVESALNKGSIFSFSIPFAISQPNSSERVSDFNEHQIRSFLKDKHVLVAEDNPLNAMLAKTILRKWNITCDNAFNGKEALSLFEKNRYDLILTDIQMPEMGGVELASKVRASSDDQKAKMPILALTANVLKEDHDHYLRSGINAVALKPFFEKELINSIRLVLENFALTERAPK